MSQVYFCVSAFRNIQREVTRWFHIGEKEKGKPFEAVGFPLSHLILKEDVHKSPAETVSFEDVEAVVITHVAIPPDEIKNYSPYRANFKKRGKNVEKFNQLFSKRRIDPVIHKYPLLMVCSRIHSHPFGKLTVNSKGDLETCMRDEVNARRNGLLFSLSFIMTVKKSSNGKMSWEIFGYVVKDGQQDPVSIKLIADDDSLARTARRQPYYKKSQGIIWERRVESHLTENVDCFEKKRLSRGWTSIWAKVAKQELILVVPPFFPHDNPRAYRTDDGKKFRDVSGEYLKIFGTDMFPEAGFIRVFF